MLFLLLLQDCLSQHWEPCLSSIWLRLLVSPLHWGTSSGSNAKVVNVGSADVETGAVSVGTSVVTEVPGSCAEAVSVNVANADLDGVFFPASA